jgi:hypothetical protein
MHLGQILGLDQLTGPISHLGQQIIVNALV